MFGFLPLLKLFGGFIADNIKPILIAIGLFMIFAGGVMFEGKRKDKEIAAINAAYAKREKQRDEEINKRIALLQDQSKKAADKLMADKKQAESDAEALRKAYMLETSQRATRIKELQDKIAQLKHDNANKAEIDQATAELLNLSQNYMLSPKAVETINGFVEVFGK